MTHWLENAEKRVSSEKGETNDVENKIDNKKDEIKANRIEIEERYIERIEILKQYVLRINNLPKSERNPFDIIEFKQKDNNLNNLFYKFSSSRRFTKREFTSLISPFKDNHYKNSRAFYISIAKEKQFVLLEYKEITAKRIKREEGNKGFLPFFSSKTKSKPSHEVTHKSLIVPLASLNDKKILKHLDWLAFKINTRKFIKEIG